jgi:hypothetical protein
MTFHESFRRRLPRPLYVVARSVYRQRPAARRERQSWKARARVAQEVADELGTTVLSGPFRGLKLPIVGWDFPAKLVGSYEAELHETLERLLASDFTTLVNVGCAEGYYAVGFGLRRPGMHIVGYDIASEHRANCLATARANAVPVEVRGECSIRDLVALRRDALAIIDCEGAEDQILSSDIIATLLVELHEWHDTTLPDRVIERFSGTRRVEIVHSTSRDPAAYPELDFLGPEDRQLALFERPTSQRWMIVRPR